MLSLVLAGLRIGEALALRWRDVELLSDPPALRIARTWDPSSKSAGAGHRGIEVAVKTGEAGTVTIGPRLLRILLDLRAAARVDGADDLVFSSRKGTHLNPANWRVRVFREAVTRANVRLAKDDRPQIPSSLTPHDLRRTYCCLLVAQGEDLAVVAAQMRHADLTTTLRYYTLAQRHRREGVAQRLDEAIRSAVPT